MTFDEQAAALEHKDIVKLLASHQQLTSSSKAQSEEIAELRRQLEWFKRQLPPGRRVPLGSWVHVLS